MIRLNMLVAAGKPHALLHERVTPHVILQDGENPLEITINDTPLARIIFSFQEFYPKREESFSACWRFQALGELFEHTELSPWAHRSGTEWEIDDTVFYVAATAPLNAKGKFLVKPFCEALTRWEQEHPDNNQEDES
jgi:hypothetical protein